jgi:hypothetical protein
MFKKVDYTILIVLTIVLGLAPFSPEPHVVQKLKMLSDGTLTRSIDIFDLFFHLAPLAALILKYVTAKMAKS